jgi:hypothetical protein
VTGAILSVWSGINGFASRKAVLKVGSFLDDAPIEPAHSPEEGNRFERREAPSLAHDLEKGFSAGKIRRRLLKVAVGPRVSSQKTGDSRWIGNMNALA